MDKTEIQPNLYIQLQEKFHMMVPVMLNDEEGKELQLPMVILTAREENIIKQAAYVATRAMFKEVPKKDELSNWDEIFDNHNAILTLFYAIRLPNDLKKQFFLNKQQLEDQYTTEQLGILANAYLTVKLNQPHLKMLDETDGDAFESLIQEIIKAGSQPSFFLNGYTTHSLKQLIHYLVQKLPQETLQTDSGLSGTA